MQETPRLARVLDMERVHGTHTLRASHRRGIADPGHRPVVGPRQVWDRHIRNLGARVAIERSVDAGNVRHHWHGPVRAPVKDDRVPGLVGPARGEGAGDAGRDGGESGESKGECEEGERES